MGSRDRLQDRLRHQLGQTDPFGQSEEFCDVVRGRYASVDQEGALGAVSLVVGGDPERRAMGHVGDGGGLDDGLAVDIPPDLPGVTVDGRFRHRLCGQPVHVEPLLDDLVGVRRIDGSVGAAVPHRKFGPASPVLRGVAHEIAELAGRAGRRLEHPSQGFLHIAGDAVGQAGDDGAAGEDFRIGRQHGRGHGAAGGKSGDEDAAAVDTEIVRRPFDHLPDRVCLAAVAPSVLRLKPVEAAVGIVRGLLFGHQQHKTVAFGQRGPAGAEIISDGVLRASMQDYDERGCFRQFARREREHPQLAGIGAEAGDFRQPAAATPQTARQASRALDFV